MEEDRDVELIEDLEAPAAAQRDIGGGVGAPGGQVGGCGASNVQCAAKISSTDGMYMDASPGDFVGPRDDDK